MNFFKLLEKLWWNGVSILEWTFVAVTTQVTRFTRASHAIDGHPSPIPSSTWTNRHPFLLSPIFASAKPYRSPITLQLSNSMLPNNVLILVLQCHICSTSYILAVEVVARTWQELHAICVCSPASQKGFINRIIGIKWHQHISKRRKFSALW